MTEIKKTEMKALENEVKYILNSKKCMLSWATPDNILINLDDMLDFQQASEQYKLDMDNFKSFIGTFAKVNGLSTSDVRTLVRMIQKK